MDYMDNSSKDVERVAERVGAEVFGKPCECHTREGLTPFEIVATPAEDGATMCVGLPLAVGDLPKPIAESVFREVFRAVNGDPTARPSAALNAAYHTMAEAMVDDPRFMRDPALDDAMALYVDAELVPDYATAFVYAFGTDSTCAMPLHFACSCALSRRLVEEVKASTATQEEETRLLALALAQPMGLVMSGRTGSVERTRAGLALTEALGISDEDFDTLHEIIDRICEEDGKDE